MSTAGGSGPVGSGAARDGIWSRARSVIPGGVNSPVRSFRSVDGEPFFVERGEGAYLVDTEGRRYLDYVLSWGPLILGHAHPAVTRALEEQLGRGTSYGAPTVGEVELAERLVRLVPGIEMVRLVNSGTEATMSALRVARAFTGRTRFIKFAGCYHGHADPFLAAAGSGVATLGLPDSPGVPVEAVENTILLPFNDLGAVEQTFARQGDSLAAVFLEPVMGNAGLIAPVAEFLEGLRALTARHGALLVFDEVMTGFRVGLGGAQERYGVTPDLTVLGKVIGGGLPVGAFGGRAAIMSQVAPAGPVYQAGTLSGNPLATAAGNAQLAWLEENDPFDRLEAYGRRLVDGITAALGSTGIPASGTVVGSMWGIFFHPGPVLSFETAGQAATARFARFHREMLSRGIFLAPSAFEAGFLSVLHGEDELEFTLEAALAAARAI
ncbi:MAG: glutamate-1-semialdehyde 2,1-aminomutase [Gammaproteobacteria bacterium]|nr:glutamate-1-semialdehyde 2,1-aminomutase [Gammaproteobacteria bacterium]